MDVSLLGMVKIITAGVSRIYRSQPSGGMSALDQKQTLQRILLMSALPPKADIVECDWRVVPIGDSGGAASKSITSLAALSRRLFPRRCEELQCDSRKAIFSAANKAEAVNAERNLLVWNGIFMALFLGTLQVT